MQRDFVISIAVAIAVLLVTPFFVMAVSLYFDYVDTVWCTYGGGVPHRVHSEALNSMVVRCDNP